MKIFRTVDGLGIIRYTNENGEHHREDGPAIEYSNGTKSWYINGLRHREDGPARILNNGIEFYYLNGISYSKDEWEKEIIKIKLKRIKDL